MFEDLQNAIRGILSSPAKMFFLAVLCCAIGALVVHCMTMAATKDEDSHYPRSLRPGLTADDIVRRRYERRRT